MQPNRRYGLRVVGLGNRDWAVILGFSKLATHACKQHDKDGMIYT